MKKHFRMLLLFILFVATAGQLQAQAFGIGNLSPQTTLDIAGQGTDHMIRLKDTALNATIEFRLNTPFSGTPWIGTTAPTSLGLGVNNTEVIRLHKSGNVGINVNPDMSALLDIASTSQGVLLPRMTKAQRLAIGSPATSLLVFDTDTSLFYYYGASGWTALQEKSQLEKITENGKTGYRILGKNPANYGDIGDNAVDLSTHTAASTTHGATGLYSFAAGQTNTASGGASTAMGFGGTASGLAAGTIGNLCVASGNYSFAAGANSRSLAESAVSMGYQNESSAIRSVSLGGGNTASGTYSTAIGRVNIASGESAVAIGETNVATGIGSFSGGLNNASTGMGAAAIGYGVFARSAGETAVGSMNTDYAPGSATLYNTNDRAFVVGIGNFAANTRRNGFIVYKNGTIELDSLITPPAVTRNRIYVTNDQLYYDGSPVSVPGELEKIIEGGNTGYRIRGRNTANYGDIGAQAVDLSFNTIASTVNGATGTYSFAAGFNVSASQTGAVAIGTSNTAAGASSVALGNGNLSAGGACVTLGSANNTSADYGVAIGYRDSVFAMWSYALGYGNKTYSMFSAGIGSGNILRGTRAHAFGTGNTGVGDNSVSVGTSTIAKSYAEVTLGLWNDTLVQADAGVFRGDTNRVLTVGTGTSAINRRTGFVIQQNGNVGIGVSKPDEKLHVNGNVNINSSFTLEFGADVTGKEPNAGKIGYNTFTVDALDIVGAGTSGSNRKIKFWNEGGAIFAGNATGPGFIVTSDARFKKDIQPLQQSTALLQQLRGVSYYFNSKDFPDRGFNSKQQIGFLAQEVEAVLPQLVYTDADGYKSVNYTELIPLLTEAIKEQQQELNQQKQINQSLQQQIDGLKKIISSVK